MCHAPALCFNIQKRGFLREGYYADLAIVDIDEQWQVDRSNIFYKCNWSPFEGHIFTGSVQQTFINGHLAYDNLSFNESKKGMRLLFDHPAK